MVDDPHDPNNPDDTQDELADPDNGRDNEPKQEPAATSAEPETEEEKDKDYKFSLSRQNLIIFFCVLIAAMLMAFGLGTKFGEETNAKELEDLKSEKGIITINFENLKKDCLKLNSDHEAAKKDLAAARADLEKCQAESKPKPAVKPKPKPAPAATAVPLPPAPKAAETKAEAPREVPGPAEKKSAPTYHYEQVPPVQINNNNIIENNYGAHTSAGKREEGERK